MVAVFSDIILLKLNIFAPFYQDKISWYIMFLEKSLIATNDFNAAF